MKNRKNIQKLIGILLLIFAQNACVDVLDKVPSDKIGIERILNKNTVGHLRDNCYDNLDNSFTGYYSGELPESYTDDAFRSGTGVNFDWHNGLLSPNQPMFASTIWNNCWQGIRKCNLALLYLPQSTAPKDMVSDQDIVWWCDEVKILRAWYHFSLIRIFGPVPFIEEAFSPNFMDWDQLTRPTFDEISARIVAEIDEVISAGNLPLRWQVSSDYGKVNLAVAYALKSRVLLYNASLLNNPAADQAKWQKAAAAAQACLNSVIPEYGLLPMSEYADLFDQASSVLNKEIIFRSSTNDASTMNNKNGVDLKSLGSSTQSSNCGAVPTQELVDCFELTSGILPVVQYNNTEHTSVTLSSGYREDPGSNPYEGRDARLAYAVVFNGAKYGKYKGQSASSPELTIYTYNGKSGTGFNNRPTSQEEADQRLSTTGYYGRKFRSASYWGSTAGGTNSHKIYFRLAEIYLNLAETQCELNNLDGAVDALNVIRVRAGQPPIGSVPGYTKTKDFLMKKIRNERRVELCFEGHRFYDQRRWKILNETNNVITGMKITSTGGKDQGPFTYERVKIDVPRNATTDKYLVLPIPLEEARRLPGLEQPDAWK